MTEQFNILQHLEDVDTSHREELIVPELKMEKPFQLVEPSLHEVKLIRKKYVRMSKDGIDMGKSKMDELTYAMVAKVLYYEGEPVFDSVDTAQRVLERHSVSVSNQIIKACQAIIGDSGSDEDEIEGMEKN